MEIWKYYLRYFVFSFSVFLFLVSAFFYFFIYDVNNSQYTIYIYDDMVDRYNNHDIIIKI